MTPVIKLSNGSSFEDPSSRIREYCEIEVYTDRNFKGGYDDRLNITNKITKEDLEAANNLYARMSTLDFKKILGNPDIPRYLSDLEDLELGDTSDEEWTDLSESLGTLLSSFISIRNINLGKATTILHLKRPHLFPILNSTVVKFLTGNDMRKNIFSIVETLKIALDSFEIVRKDVIANKATFADLRNQLADLPTPLTTVRMYDILCWTQEKWVNQADTNAPFGRASKSLGQRNEEATSPPRMDQTPAGPPVGQDETIEEAISTIREFRQIKLHAEGVIVNSVSSPPRAHRPICEELTEERFQTAMVFNEGKGGKYYFRNNLGEAVKDFGAVACKKCKPERPIKVS